MGLLVLNFVGSMLAAFASLYLGQQWLDDNSTSRTMTEAHRTVLFALCCLCAWHAVDASLLTMTLVIWCLAVLWVLRIVARSLNEHRLTGWRSYQ